MCYIPRMKTMGIDYGSKRIGVAVSDDSGIIATPLCVVDGRKSLKAEIGNLIAENSIEKIVMGNPLTMKGEVGPASQKVEKMAERFRGWFDIEIVLWDERLSSAQADRTASAAGKRDGTRDMSAATIILQSYLDSLK